MSLANEGILRRHLLVHNVNAIEVEVFFDNFPPRRAAVIVVLVVVYICLRHVAVGWRQRGRLTLKECERSIFVLDDEVVSNAKSGSMFYCSLTRHISEIN